MPETADPTLDQLRVLAAIADAGSFSAAARRLNRAQSVISYTVANLEAQLGVTLFDRAGRTPVLTEAGRALMADARRIGLLVDEMRARALSLQRGTEAEVALAVDVMFPIDRLVCVLRDFAAAFPSTGLRLRVEALGGPAQLVIDGTCGLAVSGWPGALADVLNRRVIGRITLFPVVSPDHALAQAAIVTTAMARAHTQLVLSDSSRMTEGQDYGVLALRTWRLGDMGARHKLLLAGLGWANMPDHLVEEDLRAGRLVRLTMEAQPEHHYPISLLSRLDRPAGPATAWLATRLEGVAAPARPG